MVAAAVAQKNRFDVVALAVAMLAVGAARHYLWALVPAPMRGLASKCLGAVAILALLAVVVWLAGSLLVAAVAAWWAAEEAQVVLCTSWYAIEPWHVPEGAAMCSAKAGFDLGAVGIVAVSVLLWRITCKN